MPYLSMASPIGHLTLFEEADALLVLEFGQAPDSVESPLLVEVRDQLEAYFDGRLTAFTVPLAPVGTPFQHAVWKAMRDIPYGSVRTYGALAKKLGSAPRAVGGASARNPIPILIPCHRIVGSTGALTGYSGGEGIATKRALLRLEGTPGF